MNNSNNTSNSGNNINSKNNLVDRGLKTDNDKSQTSRQKVDNAIDSAGSEALHKMGVPKKVAEKAVKNDGGKFNPANLPGGKLAKNQTRNKMASGLDKLNGSNNTDQKSGQKQNNGRNLLNGMKNNAKPQDARNQKLDKALRVAKHIPIPKVKAAANALDKLNKFSLKNSLLSGAKNTLFGNDKNKSNNAVIDVIVTIGLKKIVMFLFPLIFFITIFVSVFSIIAEGSDFQVEFNEGLCVSDNNETNNNDKCDESNENANEFHQRVKEVKERFSEDGKDFNALYIAGFYIVMSQQKDSNIKYETMTTEKIETLANAMFKEENGTYTFDEETFRDNLKKEILPEYFSNTKNEKYYDHIVDEIFDYVERYKGYFNKTSEDDDEDVCYSGGSCTYTIDGKKVTGLKIRLGQCAPPWGQGTSFNPTGEQDVDFEHYVMGVAYGEIGDVTGEEAIKTQIIFARTYTIRRKASSAQNIKNNIKVMRNCVADQVYCDPDTGCYKLNDGNQGGQVRQGINENYQTYKNKAAENSKIRSAAAAVTGVYFTGGDASYASTKQNLWSSYAKNGYDYKQIIIATAGRNVKIEKSSCASSDSCSSEDSTSGKKSSGNYASWKQYQGPWINIRLGNSSETIRSAGCTATSIAMLIAKSGTKTTVDGKFNPGTFVKKLSASGGFTGSGALNWSAISSAAPNFSVVGDVSLTGDKASKARQIKEVLDKGYYPIVQLDGGGHWVAVDTVSGSDVTMMDPGSSSTNMWSKYSVSGTIRMVYFKAS